MLGTKPTKQYELYNVSDASLGNLLEQANVPQGPLLVLAKILYAKYHIDPFSIAALKKDKLPK